MAREQALCICGSRSATFSARKKEVINPFNGESNFDNIRQSDDISYSPTVQRPKRYEPSDGEIKEFEEI